MNLNALKTAARSALWRASPEAYRKLLPARSQQTFSIGIATASSPLQLAPRCCQPVINREHVTDVPAAFVADPFLIRRDGRWHMFFEVLNGITRNGQIGYASSRDGLNWRYEQTVLEEPFHLAYPYVFEWRDDVYMLPDNHSDGIRLYRARQFPFEWEFVHELQSGSYFNDTSLVEINGNWFMFSAWSKTGRGTPSLRLFSAGTPLGPWVEHPASPIVEADKRIARPAGRPAMIDGQLYRFTQDCSRVYGEHVFAIRINHLTTTHYSECRAPKVPLLSAGTEQWNAGGMHHIDARKVGEDRWMAAVDGWFA
jgi:hypothetical protein